MSSLLRVELLAVTDEFLVGQIYTVAVAFYDPADYLGAPAVPPQNAERLTAIRLSDNEFESTSLQRRVTRKIASAAMQQDGLRRLGAGSALGNDRVAQNANPVARLRPEGRFLHEANPFRPAGRNHVAWL